MFQVSLSALNLSKMGDFYPQILYFWKNICRQKIGGASGVFDGAWCDAPLARQHKYLWFSAFPNFAPGSRWGLCPRPPLWAHAPRARHASSPCQILNTPLGPAALPLRQLS